ncbi:hypothetical protein [Jannaschia sp. CCS1]|uniref:hypothetical protein n=1 Tax=Jannaschia sp. (strain CCS1) TaxID=290400 RepID=UPI000053A813|nr:hypothetical protein [Jannaschia sp. CCS1]ABD54027.1 hypothetical protein Jann_1110 [Jannaschia sp. CCS1]
MKAAALVATLLASPVAAEGFAVSDLQTLSVDLSALSGGTFLAEATSPQRLTIMCTDCAAFQAIDVRIGRQDDGTEARLRAGQTTIGDVRAMCQARDPSCTLEGIEQGRAIGWLTTYDGAVTGSTALLFLDGDLLTIRSIADDVTTARRNVDGVRAALVPVIVGSE